MNHIEKQIKVLEALLKEDFLDWKHQRNTLGEYYTAEGSGNNVYYITIQQGHHGRPTYEYFSDDEIGSELDHHRAESLKQAMQACQEQENKLTEMGEDYNSNPPAEDMEEESPLAVYDNPKLGRDYYNKNKIIRPRVEDTIGRV